MPGRANLGSRTHIGRTSVQIARCYGDCRLVDPVSPTQARACQPATFVAIHARCCAKSGSNWVQFSRFQTTGAMAARPGAAQDEFSYDGASERCAPADAAASLCAPAVRYSPTNSSIFAAAAGFAARSASSQSLRLGVAGVRHTPRCCRRSATAAPVPNRRRARRRRRPNARTRHVHHGRESTISIPFQMSWHFPKSVAHFPKVGLKCQSPGATISSPDVLVQEVGGKLVLVSNSPTSGGCANLPHRSFNRIPAYSVGREKHQPPRGLINRRVVHKTL